MCTWKTLPRQQRHHSSQATVTWGRAGVTVLKGSVSRKAGTGHWSTVHTLREPDLLFAKLDPSEERGSRVS